MNTTQFSTLLSWLFFFVEIIVVCLWIVFAKIVVDWFFAWAIVDYLWILFLHGCVWVLFCMDVYGLFEWNCLQELLWIALSFFLQGQLWIAGEIDDWSDARLQGWFWQRYNIKLLSYIKLSCNWIDSYERYCIILIIIFNWLGLM